MAAVAKLKQSQAPLLLAEYFSKCRLAEERRVVEDRAAITIQAHARGFLIRRRLQRLTWNVVTIQQYWRGYLGRLRARLALEVYNRALRKAYFNAMATVIQRWWRGYYSRKHIHDYHARKRYLQQIKERNNQIRSELNLEAERAIIKQRQEAEERARKLFADKLSKLHHLVSTSVQPGIFNSPYIVATGTLPVIMGLTVEEHLKLTLKAQLGSKTGAAAAAATAGGMGTGAAAQAPGAGIGSGGGAGVGLGATGSPSGSGRLPPLRSGSKGPLRSGSGGRSGSAGANASLNGSGRISGGGTGQMVEAAGRTVPVRYTLRQTADYEAVHKEALIEEKVHRGEMLSHHPQAFTTALGAPKAPFFNLQSNRNLLPYEDPYDPTVGLRGPRFTPEQKAVSSSAFNRYIKRHHVFDKDMAAEAY